MGVTESTRPQITRRVYNLGVVEFFAWYGQGARGRLNQGHCRLGRVAMEARGLGAVSIDVRITVVRKLAVEAVDNGLLAPEIAAAYPV
jgi:hypothetical protein